MHIFFKIIFYFLGWLALFLKYRNIEHMKKAKNNEYAGSYANAGSIVFLKSFLFVFATFLLIFLLTAVIVTVVKS